MLLCSQSAGKCVRTSVLQSIAHEDQLTTICVVLKRDINLRNLTGVVLNCRFILRFGVNRNRRL